MVLPKLPDGIYFVKGPRQYKYTAILPSNRRVNFGHKDYQHYKDSVPKRLGGKLYSSLDHKDPERRKRYQQRHKKVLNKYNEPAYRVRYSPSWFSYYFLW